MKDSRQNFSLMVAPAVDGLLITAAGWAAYFFRWSSWSLRQDYLLVLILGAALAVILLPLSGAYRPWRGQVQWQHAGHALPGLALVALMLTLIGALTKTTADFSRLWMAYWFTLSIVALSAYRWVLGKVQQLLAPRSAHRRKVLIIGDGELAVSVAEKIRAHSGSSMEVCGFIATGDRLASGPPLSHVWGDLQQLDSLIADPELAIDEIWIAVSDFKPGQREQTMRVLRRSCHTIRFVPDLSMLALINHVPGEIAGMTVIDLSASPLDGHNAMLKALFDKVFAALALVLLAPLMCVIAVAIKLESKGPVFFLQQRHGSDGRIIRIFKFRTMKDTDIAADKSRQAVRNDPRVTTVGRVLRRSSLDELPQFINVLLGDMSVVGPRPHPLSLNEEFVEQIDAYMQRHRVKPGITGWAQIHGFRGETQTLEKMQRRIEYDLYYIEHWSLWLDVKIIIRTLIAGWTGDNAY